MERVKDCEFFKDCTIDDNNEALMKDTIQSLLDSNRLYEIVSVLLFNDYDYDFLLIKEPGITEAKDKFNRMFLSSHGKSFLKPKHGSAAFSFEPRNKIQRFIDHPEHLYGYIVRYGENVYGEYFYCRGTFDFKIMLGRILYSFMLIAKHYSINDFEELFANSLCIRGKLGKHVPQHMPQISNVDFIRSDAFLDSVKHFKGHPASASNDYENIFLCRFLKIESYFQLNVHCLNYMNVLLIEANHSLYFETQLPQPSMLFHTDIHKPVTIISKDDNIADILFALAVEIDASCFNAAVGYAYDSGINQLMPLMNMTHLYHETGGAAILRPSKIIIGGLQKYPSGGKIKELNKNTARLINELTGSCIMRVFTYPDSFYHGKFYYLSGKDISYVIVGSSNITQSAYDSNYELDVLYRFNNNEENALKNEFLSWFDELESKCTELTSLDEDRFSANTYSDENGNHKGDSFYKTLTDEEEQKRYELLMLFNPSNFIKEPLKKNKLCYPFRGCVAFVYEEKNIILLEEFSYGHACYAFSASDINAVKSVLMNKSKSDIKKNSDILISVIDHDENYEVNIRKLLS